MQAEKQFVLSICNLNTGEQTRLFCYLRFVKDLVWKPSYNGAFLVWKPSYNGAFLALCGSLATMEHCGIGNQIHLTAGVCVAVSTLSNKELDLGARSSSYQNA